MPLMQHTLFEKTVLLVLSVTGCVCWIILLEEKEAGIIPESIISWISGAAIVGWEGYFSPTGKMRPDRSNTVWSHLLMTYGPVLEMRKINFKVKINILFTCSEACEAFLWEIMKSSHRVKGEWLKAFSLFLAFVLVSHNLCSFNTESI